MPGRGSSASDPMRAKSDSGELEDFTAEEIIHRNSRSDDKTVQVKGGAI
jgi:hypothetical protein